MNDLSETRFPSSSVGDYLKAVAGQRVRITKVREVRALDGVVTVEDEDAEV